MANDALNANKMNVGRWETAKMRNTIWGGRLERLVDDDDGIPKGMRIILVERGVDMPNTRAKEMRELLKTFPDFRV